MYKGFITALYFLGFKKIIHIKISVLPNLHMINVVKSPIFLPRSSESPNLTSLDLSSLREIAAADKRFILG